MDKKIFKKNPLKGVIFSISSVIVFSALTLTNLGVFFSTGAKEVKANSDYQYPVTQSYDEYGNPVNPTYPLLSDTPYHSKVDDQIVQSPYCDCAYPEPTTPAPQPTPSPLINHQVQNNTQINNQTQVLNTPSSQPLLVQVPPSKTETKSGEVLGVNRIDQQPKVIAADTTPIIALPKTGLPLAAVALLGLLPLGIKLRQLAFGNKDEKDYATANSIWEEREFKKM
jgi:hypothetical protein